MGNTIWQQKVKSMFPSLSENGSLCERDYFASIWIWIINALFIYIFFFFSRKTQLILWRFLGKNCPKISSKLRLSDVNILFLLMKSNEMKSKANGNISTTAGGCLPVFSLLLLFLFLSPNHK